MKIFDELERAIRSIGSSRKKMSETITKKELKEYIDQLKSQHVYIVSVLESSLESLATKLAQQIASNVKLYSAYTEYVKALPPDFKSREAKGPMSTLVEANKAFIAILDSLGEDVDKDFPMEKINMLNMRLSHVVYSGVLRQSECIAKYTKYLFAYISNQTIDGETIPKYRLNFLTDNTAEVVGIVTMVTAKNTTEGYKEVIAGIKANAGDYNLVDEEQKSQVSKISSVFKQTKHNEKMLMSGILGLPTFRSIGESINLIGHEFTRYITQETDWMRAHVAILNAKLGGMTEGDSDYIDLQRIVNRYESIIDMLEKSRDSIG